MRCPRDEIRKADKNIKDYVDAINQKDFKKLKDFETRIKYNVENLDIATPDEWAKYVDDVYKGGDYKNAQNIVHMADFSDEIIKQLKLHTNKAFVDKKQLSHIRAARKGTQALRDEEVLDIPNIIANAKKALRDDTHTGFSIAFRDVLNDEKINFLHFDYDELGNLMLSAQKVERKDIPKRFKNFNPKAEVGAAPTISASKIEATTTSLDTSAAKMNDSQKELKKQEILDKLKNQSEIFVNDSFTNTSPKGWEKWESKVDKAFNSGVAKEKLANTLKKLGLSDEAVEKVLNTKNHPLKVLADNLNYDYKTMANRIEMDAKYTYDLLNKYSKDDVEKVFEALDGTAKPDELPEHLQNLYGKVRKTIDDNAKELIELGVLKEENAIKDYVKHYYAKYLEQNDNIIFRLNKFGLAKTFKRKNLSEEDLKELGLQKNAFAIVNTVKEQRLQIEKAKRLKELADNYSSAEKLGDDWVRVSDETMAGGVKKYGALSGRYIPKELKDIMDDLSTISEVKGALEKYWYPLVNHLKVNLTAKNPATHLYNFGSNMGLAFFKGEFGSVWQMLRNPKMYKEYSELAQRYGLSMQGELIEQGAKKLEQNSKKGALRKVWDELYFAEGSKAGDFMRAAYNYEDAIFKVAHFKKLLDSKGIDINRIKSDKAYLAQNEKLLSDAMKRANYEYVDYGTRWNKAAQALDRGGIMPFLQYTWKSTPMVARTILKNPLKYSLYLAAVTGGGGLSLDIFGNNSKEKELFKPSWAKNGSFLPNLFFTDSWVELGGTGVYFNAGRLMPAMRFDGFDGFKIGGGFVGTMLNLADGRTSLGYEYISKNDANTVKWIKRLEETTKNFLPSMTMGRYAQNYGKLAINSLFDEKNKPFSAITDSNKQELSAGMVAARMAGVRELGQGRNAQQALNENARKLRLALSNGDKEKAKKLQAEGKEIIAMAKKKGISLKVPKGKIPKNSEGKGWLGRLNDYLNE